MRKKHRHVAAIVMVAFFVFSCQKSDLPDETQLLPAEEMSAAVPASSSNLIFEETFEGGKPFSTAYDAEDHIGNWDYAMQFVNTPVFQGQRGVRFEIRKDQPMVKNGKRAEVVIVDGPSGDIGKETWYSFSAYFPTQGYEYDVEREVIAQWYQDGTPATSLRTKKDRFLVETGSKSGDLNRYDLARLTKDVWHEFVLHFIHSHKSDGLLEIWHNGKKVFTRKAGNMYKGKLPKWKIGLYKDAFRYNSTLVNKRIVYFDNIRVGNSRAGFRDMTSL